MQLLVILTTWLNKVQDPVNLDDDLPADDRQSVARYNHNQLATKSSTTQLERGTSSFPRVVLTILWTPSISLSPGSSSPEGNLKNVIPAGLGPIKLCAQSV